MTKDKITVSIDCPLKADAAISESQDEILVFVERPCNASASGDGCCSLTVDIGQLQGGVMYHEWEEF